MEVISTRPRLLSFNLDQRRTRRKEISASEMAGQQHPPTLKTSLPKISFPLLDLEAVLIYIEGLLYQRLLREERIFHMSRNETENKSEVARLLKQIDLEFEAAQLGMSGLAEGTARHDFINARMDQVGVFETQLATHIGKNEANRLICEHYVKIIQ